MRRRVRDIFVTPLLLLTLTLMVGCGIKPRNIPDKELSAIFKEFLLVTAYSTDVLHLTMRDSVDVYTPVLEKFGYTVDDLEYTIGNVTKRKSAQLSDIMEQTIADLKDEAEDRRRLWNAWSAMLNKGRELGRDTIYHLDKLHTADVGEEGLRIEIDSLKEGRYELLYDYYIEPRTRGERVYLEMRNMADTTRILNQWGLRTNDTIQGSHNFSLNAEVESISIVWRNRGNKTRALNMSIDSICIVYTPSDSTAIELMKEQQHYTPDYTRTPDPAGRYLMTEEALRELLEKALAEEQAAGEEDSDVEQVEESTEAVQSEESSASEESTEEMS